LILPRHWHRFRFIHCVWWSPAACAGASKAQLGALCEALVVFREQQDREAQEALYRDTLRLLSGGDEQVRLLLL
jgi:hypothetical protein